MCQAVTQAIVQNKPIHQTFRFASLPGKFWRYEFSLQNALTKLYPGEVHFTGFERDANIMISGAPYVPRAKTKLLDRAAGFRDVNVLDTMYFRTNCARWVNMCVNDALTLTPKHFAASRFKAEHLNHEWFLKKFCQWHGVWLDYYGPASDKMGRALQNLHWHCHPLLSRIPVGVTVLKGRAHGMAGSQVRPWLEAKLSGGGVFPGITFETMEYFEYADEGCTMANIIGFIVRQ